MGQVHDKASLQTPSTNSDQFAEHYAAERKRAHPNEK